MHFRNPSSVRWLIHWIAPMSYHVWMAVTSTAVPFRVAGCSAGIKATPWLHVQYFSNWSCLLLQYTLQAFHENHSFWPRWRMRFLFCNFHWRFNGLEVRKSHLLFLLVQFEVDFLQQKKNAWIFRTIPMCQDDHPAMVSWSAPNLLEAKVARWDGKIGLAAKMEDEETGDAWIKLARDVFLTWIPK